MANEAYIAAVGQIPEDVRQWVILTNHGDQTSCAWWGMSAEQAAQHLRAVADGICGQRGVGRARH